MLLSLMISKINQERKQQISDEVQRRSEICSLATMDI